MYMMLKKSTVRRMRRGPALFVVAALVILTGVAAFALQSDKPQKAAVQSAAKVGSSAKQLVTSNNKHSTTPLSDETVNEQSLDQPPVSTPQAMAAQPEPPATTTQPAKPECSLNISSRLRAYNREVNRERSDLDNSLSRTLTGIRQIREFIDTYNQDVTKLFKGYQEEFGNAGCAFPVNAAETLPLDYRN